MVTTIIRRIVTAMQYPYAVATDYVGVFVQGFRDGQAERKAEEVKHAESLEHFKAVQPDEEMRNRILDALAKTKFEVPSNAQLREHILDLRKQGKIQEMPVGEYTVEEFFRRAKAPL